MYTINEAKRKKLEKHCIHFSNKGCRIKGCKDKDKWAHNGATNILNGGEVKTSVMLKGLEQIAKDAGNRI